MEKTTVDIAGMHCRSCEILIEDELSKVPGICRVVVSHTKGTAEIFYKDKLNDAQVEQAINTAGYSLGRDERFLFSKNPRDYRDLVIAAAILLNLYIIARFFGIFNFNLAGSNNYASLPVVLLIGVTAGLSTCMALVGGLVLGASASFAQKHPNASALEKFTPHLYFNLGRVVAFFVLGGLIGFAGSFFQISTTVLGFLTIVVGMVMFLLGAQLTGISPAIKAITLPKIRLLGDRQQHPAVLGAMTFFLPCGFTQAMQLFAISSGSAVIGALTMGVFAIGTAPGLLGIGGLTSVVKGAFGRLFFKTAGLVVVILAFFNISNGYNLTGFSPSGILAFFGPPQNAVAEGPDPNVTLVNGVQLVRMTQDISGYSPNSFTIKKGIPVRWVINSTEPNSCASSIVAPKVGIKRNLEAGENILEFTPKETGQIRFTCIMGMFGGVFNVVDSQTNVVPTVAAPPSQGGCGSSGGCGCGGSKPQPVVQAVPSGQILKTTYTNDEDIRPNSFTVKAGQPIKLEVDVKEDGYGCMGSIAVPGLTNRVEMLRKGSKIVFDLNSSKPGRYPITCAMGVPRGEINVN